MRILITGGCGFVGRHFARRFLDAGNAVTVVDNMVEGIEPSKWMFKCLTKFRQNLQFVKADLRDFQKINRANEFDLIVHCAAIVGGRLIIDGNPLLVATDLALDSEFLYWCALGANKPKVVYFSSSAVYPLDRQTRDSSCELFESLCDTNHYTWHQPDMTYGFVKFAGEYLCQFAAKHYELDVVIYRPFGGYGEDQGFNYPFPAVIQRIMYGQNPVVVWGSGDQERDFIHIEDIVSAVLSTMSLMRPGEVLNLGSGVGTSFKQLALKAGQILGRKINVVNDATKPEGVFRRVAGIRKLSQLWTPTIGLEQGIKRVADALTARE